MARQRPFLVPVKSPPATAQEKKKRVIATVIERDSRQLCKVCQKLTHNRVGMGVSGVSVSTYVCEECADKAGKFLKVMSRLLR